MTINATIEFCMRTRDKLQLSGRVNVARRITYVIGPDGRIEAAFHHEVFVGKHLEEVRAHLQSRRS